jgi:DNA-binding transcriptional MerR regulator
MESGPWTAKELLTLAQRRLCDCPAPRDARARAELTLRNLRYYMAAGLVDRPRLLRGRVGLYDQRQLAQLIAIKRWQAEGAELRQIAERLREASAQELEQMCQPAPQRVVAHPQAKPATRSVELAPGVRLVFDAPLLLRAQELARLRRTAQRLLRSSRRRRAVRLLARSEQA